MNDFLTDVTTLRERARAKMEEGPITSSYGADREQVIDVLNEALATEIVCVLRYKRHYFMAEGLNAGPVAGRAGRDPELLGDHPLARRQGHHHPPAHGGHPRRGGGARRRPPQAPRRPAGLTRGRGEARSPYL